MWALLRSALCLQNNIYLLKDTGGMGVPTTVPQVTASLDILQELALTKTAPTYKQKNMLKKPSSVMQESP